MMETGWHEVKHGIPVDTFNDKTFRRAWSLQHELNATRVKGREYDAFNDLIQLDEDLSQFISNILGQILSVKQQAREDIEELDEDIGTDMYRIMEINLRYYRSQNIDNKIEQGMNQDRPGKNGGVTRSVVTRLKVNLEKLLNTLKKSIEQANQKFQSVESYEDETIYLLLLAERFEANIRYFGQYAQETNSGSEVIDFDNLVSPEEGDEAVQEQIENIVDQKQEMEEKIQEADQNLDDIE